MLPAPTPPNEEERLAELDGLNLLDTPREAEFDRVTERLTRLFKVPIALLTLIDKGLRPVVQIANRVAGRSCRGSVHFARRFPLRSRYCQ